MCCWYPVAWSRLENVCSVCSTFPDESRICTCKVSKAEVVLVSAVSMCSQKLSEAEVAFAGIVTCCKMVSVLVVPNPSIQASKVPEWGGSALELLMIRLVECVVVSVHGAGFDLPFSNPGLPSSCVVVPPEALIVKAIVAV